MKIAIEKQLLEEALAGLRVYGGSAVGETVSKINSLLRPPVENNPLVFFCYPSKDRSYKNPSFARITYGKVVRVISMDRDYVIGLDVHDKNRFKRFSRSKISNGLVELLEFNIPAMGKMTKSTPKIRVRKGEHIYSTLTERCVKCGVY
jgi:hypothetical protein